MARPTDRIESFQGSFASINATTSGVNTVVAAVAGKKIRVLNYVFTVAAAAVVIFQDTAGTPNVLVPGFDLSAGGGIVFRGTADSPAFETAVGEGLNISLSVVVNCRGHLAYELV